MSNNTTEEKKKSERWNSEVAPQQQQRQEKQQLSRTCSINDLADVASKLTPTRENSTCTNEKKEVDTVATTTQHTTRNIPPRSMDWDQYFEELKAFKARFGHCNVPRGYKENKKLGRWVDKQRSSYKGRFLDKSERKPWSRAMSLDHLLKLESIGFQFRLRQKPSPTLSWEERYNQLLHFRSIHGHAQVPLNWTHNTALSHWVVIQRKEHKKLLNGGKSSVLMSGKRIQMLIDIDFVFRNVTVYPYSWEERFQHLVAFHKNHGHFHVTSEYILDPMLFIWVNAQRRLFGEKNLEADRMAKLQEIGFH